MRILHNIGLELSFICVFLAFGQLMYSQWEKIWKMCLHSKFFFLKFFSNKVALKKKIIKNVDFTTHTNTYYLLHYFPIFLPIVVMLENKNVNMWSKKWEHKTLYICKKYKNPYPISLCLVIHICFHEKKILIFICFCYFTGLVKNNENLTEKKEKT